MQGRKVILVLLLMDLAIFIHTTSKYVVSKTRARNVADTRNKFLTVVKIN